MSGLYLKHNYIVFFGFFCGKKFGSLCQKPMLGLYLKHDYIIFVLSFYCGKKFGNENEATSWKRVKQ